MALNLTTGVSMIPPMTAKTQIKAALKSAPDLKTMQENAAGPDTGTGLIKKRYDRMCGPRAPYLDEARNVSATAMPFLYPPEAATDLFSVESANQSLVTRGIFNLSKELSSTILPSNAKFFQNRILPALAKFAQEAEALQVQQEQQQQAQSNPMAGMMGGQQGGPSQGASKLSQMNNKLVGRDEVIRQAIKTTPDAENLNRAMMHAIVAGEVCFAKPTLEASKVYTLNNFVAEFDSSGEMVDVIVRDVIHPSKFAPEDLQELFGTNDLEDFEAIELHNIPVYTRQVRRYDHYEIQVEIAGQRFKKMEGKEDLDSPPFIVFPFLLFEEQEYGVGWLTHNRGDVFQFENTSLSINMLTQAACKVVSIIPPEMKTTQAELESAGMSFIFGSPSPIQMVFADISRNLTAVTAVYQMSQTALQAAFLLKDAVRRNAERVTAEEIREAIEGLRDLLGGLYLSLARRFQYPYINRMIKLLEREGRIDKLPPDTVELVLTAGVETLEAAEDLHNLDQWVQRMAVNPEWAQRINSEEIGTRWGNDLMIDLENLMLDDEALQEAQGVSQLVQMSKAMGPQGPAMAAMVVQQMLKNPEGAMQMVQSMAGGGGQQPQGEAPVDPAQSGVDIPPG